MLPRDGLVGTSQRSNQLVRSDAAPRRLGWYQVTLIFFLWSIAGLIIEELWMRVSVGLEQSRAGLVWGPFSPLYGTGAVLLTAVLLRLHDLRATPWQIFFVSMLMGGILEQTTGWTMETFFGLSSWDYIAGHVPGALSKWVAVPFLFVWGALGSVWDRFVMPGLLHAIGKPATKGRTVFVALIGAFLAIDILVTIACFSRVAERELNIPPSNALEEWVDTQYNDEFVEDRFQNIKRT